MQRQPVQRPLTDTAAVTDTGGFNNSIDINGLSHRAIPDDLE